MKKYIFLLFILYAALSCNRNRNRNTNTNTIELNYSIQNIDIDVKSEDEFLFSLLYDSCEIITLNSIKENLGEISKIRIDSSSIYILSQNKLYLFNKKGIFLNIYDKKGKGPKEYLNIEDFIVTETDVQFIDFNQQKVIFLDKSLHYIKNTPIDFYASSFYQANDKTYIFNHNSSGYNDSNNKISIRDERFKVIDGFFPMSKTFMYYYYVIEKNNYCQIGNNIHFLHSPYDTIYQFKDRKITPVYALNFGDYKMPLKNYEKKYNDIYEFYLSAKKSNYVCYVDSYFENDSSLFFSYGLKGVRKHVFYNKKNNKILNSSSFVDDINFLNFKMKSTYDNYPSAITSTHHYYVLQSYELIQRIDKNKVKNNKLVELKDKINIYSSPIIFKMRLK